jgi:hypothetical protein
MNYYYILKEYEQNLMYIEDILKTSSTTNNFQLEKLCKKLFGDLFIGVFTADKYPKYISNGEMFIINNRKNKGEHWISVIKYNNKMYAYDTFNRNIHKVSIFWKNNNWISANKNRDQSYYEYDCGERCISWLISFHKHGPRIINII